MLTKRDLKKKKHIMEKEIKKKKEAESKVCVEC